MVNDWKRHAGTPTPVTQTKLDDVCFFPAYSPGAATQIHAHKNWYENTTSAALVVTVLCLAQSLKRVYNSTKETICKRIRQAWAARKISVPKYGIGLN